jgi:hypothetical protein
MTNLANLPASAIRVAVGAALIVAGALANARAAEPAARDAVLTPLGDQASALTYWVDEPEGFRVVTTVDTSDASERHALVRSSIVLRPGQTQTIQVPGALGETSPTLEIRRLGDRVVVSPVVPASALAN